MRTRLVFLLALLALAGSNLAQDRGSGVIVAPNWLGSEYTRIMNPLLCNEPTCQTLNRLLFPRLIGVDPATGLHTDTGLARRWTHTDGVVTLFLHDDVTWSDGKPVTAYDVAYTYLVALGATGSPFHAGLERRVENITVEDDHTLRVDLALDTCSALYDLNLPVVSAADFAFTSLDAWDTDYPQPTTSSATAGSFTFAGVNPQEAIRAITPDGSVALEYRDITSVEDAIERFRSGEFNLIQSPRLDVRAELRHRDPFQVYAYSNGLMDFISLNLADPEEPESAFDEDGNPLEQGVHPIFGDVRVRRALQLGIDVEALIEVAVRGEGVVLPANLLPTSWAYDDTLAPVGHDPIAATRMLEAAGWRQLRRGEARTCIGCATTDDGTPLRFTLAFDGASERQSINANLITTQLGRIGVEVELNPSPASNELRNQRYDAILSTWRIDPVDPDHSVFFTTANDTIGTGYNGSSYHNPQVDALYAEAEVLPGCDIGERTAIYQEIQTILQADQPYLWLYAPLDMVAVSANVLGFDPLPLDPLWNITEWTIWEG